MLYKSRLLSRITTFALTSVIALSIPMSASAATTSSAKMTNNIKINMNGNEFEPNSPPFIEKGTVYLPVRDIGELLGTVVFWNYTEKTVTMTYPELTVKLKYGSMTAIVNGKSIELTAPLRMVNDRIFVPLRFFSEATGANVVWNNSKKLVSISQSDNYIKGIGINASLWLDRKNGDFYIAHPFEQSPVLVGQVDAEFKDSISINVPYMNSNNMVIQILDNSGEPHINFDVYSILVHSDKIVSQKKAQYYKRYEQNDSFYNYLDPNTNKYVTNTMLTDGKILTIFNPEGKVIKEYDLPALVGKDESYSIQGVGEDYLVVRPNQTGYLTLINLKDNSTVELYKKMLSGDDLNYAMYNDIPYFGDELNFYMETEDGILRFYNRNPLNDDMKDKLFTYNLNTGETGVTPAPSNNR